MAKKRTHNNGLVLQANDGPLDTSDLPQRPWQPLNLARHPHLRQTYTSRGRPLGGCYLSTPPEPAPSPIYRAAQVATLAAQPAAKPKPRRAGKKVRNLLAATAQALQGGDIEHAEDLIEEAESLIRRQA